MASFVLSYFLFLILVANIFNFQTSLCDIHADEALIAGIRRQVQDNTFCLNTFVKIIPTHPYIPDEVTRVAIAQALQNANDNHIFIKKSKAQAKDKSIQDLYAICDIGYGVLVNELEDSSLELAKKDYNVTVTTALGSNTTPEMLDRSRKQMDLVLMATIAEGLIRK
ncbi:unnamed protein product [Withania somnifera]